MTLELNPGLLLIVGGVLLPLLGRGVRLGFALALPVIGAYSLWHAPDGMLMPIEAFGLTLELYRVDSLSRIFGYIFLLAAFLGGIYAAHLKTALEPSAALIYAGAAIGAVFAGDLISLFVFWELTALASVFLIWARGTERAYGAGMRYLLIQITSGVLLLAGLLFLWSETGSITFDRIALDNVGGVLIFVAFGIKCAFPLLHNWLADAYPEATPTGAVFLSSFTTKLAIYVLARGFAGTEILIWIGVLMTLYPMFFGVIENDLRRVLAYSTNIQLGFMVVAVGVGTELALNGAAAHAFTHILYKALLFMAMGAVLHRVGSVLGTDLGGLRKSMPWTAGFCMVGAASISAVPLFSGFVSKSMILSAAAHEGHYVVWALLLFASAGVLHYCSIKLPYAAFFSHDSGKRPREAPGNMLLAMGLTAVLCVVIGVFPNSLYALLPFATDYAVYTDSHILSQVQLLLFSALGFVVLTRSGLFPVMLRGTNLDTEWFYRRLGRTMLRGLANAVGLVYSMALVLGSYQIARILAGVRRKYGPSSLLARTWTTGNMALWVALMLGAYLLLYFV